MSNELIVWEKPNKEYSDYKVVYDPCGSEGSYHSEHMVVFKNGIQINNLP